MKSTSLALWICLVWVVIGAGCLTPASQSVKVTHALPDTDSTAPALTITQLPVNPSPLPSWSSPTPSLPRQLPATGTATSSNFPTPSPVELSLQPTQSPPPGSILEPIQFRSPGAGSWLDSPIPIHLLFLQEDLGQIIRVEVRDDQGTLLFRKLILRDQLALPDEYTGVIDFEIAEDSRDGILTVSVEDTPGYPRAVSSMNLRLLSNGTQKLLNPTWQLRTIDIQYPHARAEIAGGQVDVSGLTRLDAGEPLRVQLVDESGKVIGQRLAGITGSPGAGPGPFSAQVSYRISQQTPARLVVYRSNSQTGDVLYLASIPVLLAP